MFKLLFILLLFAINMCIVNLEHNQEDNFIPYDDLFSLHGDAFNDQENDALVQVVRDYFIPFTQFGTSGLVQDMTSRRMNLKTISLSETLSSTLKCYQCIIIAKAILKYYRSGLPPAAIQLILTEFCIQSNIVPEDVCRGVIELNVPIIIYILDRRPGLTAEGICQIFSQPNCLNSDYNYERKIDSYKYFAKQIPKIFKKKESLMPLKIIQISDIHLDPEYKENSNADCDDPLCCRESSGNPKNISSAAGHWGDYRSCDIPKILIQNTFAHIKKQHPDAAMIFYTGDSVSHNVWSTTFEQVKTTVEDISADLKLYFPDIPIFPILGNHDTQPLNQFAPSEVTGPLNSSWLYEYIARDWKQFLPESASNTLKQYGFYSVHHSSKLKIISLNSNVAYTFNWWLLYDDEYFFGQLEWLVIELIESEMQGQFVYILSHIPPGQADSYIKWQKEYQNIKVRFSHIIKGEFAGHTHLDQLRLVYEYDNVTDPVGVVFNGGSVTPFEFVNPNYRVYYADPNTYEIINYEQWVFNLTKANENQSEPDWYLLYIFKEAYNLESANPSKLNQFVDNLKTNQTLFHQYKRYEVKDANFALLEDCSNQACKQRTLCEIISTIYKDNRVCDTILGKRKKSFKYDIRDNICYKSLQQLTNMIAGAANYIDCISKCHE